MGSRRHRVRIRFYQELGDFLGPHLRGREFELAVNDGTTTKALVEHCGVPHGEVDLLLVDGESGVLRTAAPGQMAWLSSRLG
jgi:hypothetical protein